MREYHYWIYGKNPEDGKTILIYACPSRDGEDGARQRGLELLSTSGIDFTIKRLPTRDITAASRMVKGGRLDETHNVTESTRRMGHNKTLRRLRYKRQGGWGL